MVEEGFAELSFRSIAARSGVKAGNVTYYFRTKEHLMEELAVYIFDRWDAGFRKRAPKGINDKMEIFDYSIRYMIDQNKRERTSALLLEMWAMASRSDVVMRMLDTFYTKMRAWIDAMLAEVNPDLSAETRAVRAGIITSQIEGLMVLIGPRRIPHKELRGIEDAAGAAIRQLALAS